MSDPEDRDPEDRDSEDPDAAERDARRKELQRQRELRLRRAREAQEEQAAETRSGAGIDSGTVVLWTVFGIVYYALAVALIGALGFLVGSILPTLGVMFIIVVGMAPLLAYSLSRSHMDPIQKASERRGLGIAVVLFYGLSCLMPLVICGGMLLGVKGLH